MEFKLKSEFIELDNVLKALRLVNDGAQAKQHIQTGQVRVNAAVETRVRRKLRAGDVVEFAGQRIEVVAQAE